MTKVRAELVLQIVRGKVVENTHTLPATVKGHHESGLFGSPAKPGHPEAEGPMPPPGDCEPLADMFDLGLPYQRAVSK